MMSCVVSTYLVICGLTFERRPCFPLALCWPLLTLVLMLKECTTVAKKFWFEIVATTFWSEFYMQQFWGMVYLQLVKLEKQYIPTLGSS